MKVQFAAKAYLSSYHDITEVANGSHMPMICHGDSSYFNERGYTPIGTATVTIDLYTDDQIMTAKLEALHAKLQTVRAENQQRENAILDEISKLTAISYDEPF